MKLELSFSLKYYPKLALGNGGPYTERNPEIHAYLSRDVEGSRVHIARNLQQGSVVNIKLSGDIFPVNDYTSLCFNAYCETITVEDKICKDTAGSGFILMVDIPSIADGKYHRIDLIERTDKDFSKGYIKIKFEEAKIPQFAITHPEELEAARQQRVESIRERTLASFNAFRPSISILSKVRLPDYVTQFSLLPGSAFLMDTPSKPSSESYFLNLKSVCLSRNAINERWAVMVMRKQLASDDKHLVDGFNVVMMLVSEILSTFESSCYYNEDRTNETSAYDETHQRVVMTEHFKTMRLLCGADCEDGAASICITATNDLMKLETTDDFLSLCKQALGFYVPLAVLCVADQKFFLDPLVQGFAQEASGLEAHTFAALVPRKWLYDSSKKINGTKEYFSPKQGEFMPWEDSLETMLCEGTCRLKPGQKSMHSYCNNGSDLRHEVQKMTNDIVYGHYVCKRSEALRKCSREKYGTAISSGREPKGVAFHPFYKWVVSAYVSTDVQSSKFFDVSFVYHKVFQYGVTFRDFLYKSDDVATVVCTEWSKDDKRVVSEILKKNEPIPRLLCPDGRSVSNGRERVEGLLNPLHAKYGHEHSRCRSCPMCVFYIRQEEVTKEFVDSVRADMASMGSNINGFNYEYTPIAQVETTGDVVCMVDFYIYFHVDAETK